MKTLIPHSKLWKIGVGFICINLLVLIPHICRAKPGHLSEQDTTRNPMLAVPLYKLQGIAPQNDLWEAGETSRGLKGLRRDNQVARLKANYYDVGTPILIGNDPVHQESEDFRSGKKLFEKHCVMCHGHEGRGDGPFGQSLQPPAADLSSPKIQAKPDAELISAIKHGVSGTAMQAFKRRLSDQAVSNVLAYMRYFGK